MKNRSLYLLNETQPNGGQYIMARRDLDLVVTFTGNSYI